MMTIEAKWVERPPKVIAFVCGLIAIILLIIAIAANSWIEAQDYRQGLWKICTYDNLGDIETCLNPEASSRAWLLACAILSIVSLLVCVIVVIVTGIGLKTKDHTQKYKLYRVATFLMFGAFVLELIALIVFPVMFIKDLDQKSAKMQISEWYFAWSYGIAWGAAIFEIGCAILLLIDKDNEEIYYKEKTTYREPEYGH
ncbi:hypothetical protein LSH36_503g00001 [Paralvinella palmiformis]|uniref:Transmembrane protein 47 n=1 Tax=Paralvinella palmiformis TaxID=53620 RepID=A0AAD9MZ39_9ANNE|nr:hypothetical protein LSH36_503g00001 [Paralvinella palmiformis]